MDNQKVLFYLITFFVLHNDLKANGFVQYYKRTQFHFPQSNVSQFKTSRAGYIVAASKPTGLYKNSEVQVIDNNKQNVLKEGSFCRRSLDGKEGHCVLATHCLHVVRQFRKIGAKVDICTYRRKVAVICCPPLEKREVRQIQKRISVEKCEQYLDFRASFRYKRNASDPIPKCQPSNPLIVGGENTYPGEFPHMAAVGWSQNRMSVKWACGGSLISEYYILTAAHCTLLDGYPPDVVRLGKRNLVKSNEKTDPQDIRIKKVIRNPNYKMSTYYHDIALLQLKKKPRFSRFVRPACLWQFPDINAEHGVAIGWGRTKFNGKGSDILQKVDLQLAGNKLCNLIYKNVQKLPRGIIDEQFCAGILEGGKDTCLGDSGGPIHITVPEGKCVNYIIGVTSFGKFCAEPKSLGVYTKVYSYLDWIEEVAFGLS